MGASPREDALLELPRHGTPRLPHDDASSAMAGVKAVLALDDEESWRLFRCAQQVPHAVLHAVPLQARSGRSHTGMPGTAGSRGAATLGDSSAGGEAPRLDPTRPLRHFLERESVQTSMGRVAELEERAATGLNGLLEESQRALDATRQRIAAHADRSLRKLQRCGLEAELDLLRVLGSERPGAGTVRRDGPTEAEVSEAARALLAAEPYRPAHTARGAPPLAELLADLAGVCRQTTEGALAASASGRTDGPRRNAAARGALVLVPALADIMLEAERDCEALQLGLSEPVVGPGAAWVKPLAASASPVGGARPFMDSLVQQLEAENDLLVKVRRAADVASPCQAALCTQSMRWPGIAPHPRPPGAPMPGHEQAP